MDEYTKKVIYYMNNQNYVGILDKYDKKFSFKSEICGDWNDIYIKFDDLGLVSAISYENSGCSLNVVSLEIFCKYILGKNLKKLPLFLDFIVLKLDFPKEKLHCIKLILECLRE